MPMPEITRLGGRFLLLLLLLVVASFPAGAQEEGGLATLIETLETRYKVLPSSDGYVLTPRQDDSGFNLVEIEAGEVAVDGKLLSSEELRDVLGEDADPVLQLAERFARSGSEEEVEEELEQRLERLQELEEARHEQLEELRQIEKSLEEVRGSERDDERSRRHSRHRRETRMSFGNSLTIVENESARDVVVLGGSLEVLGEVRGDAVVVGGSAKVSGEVGGSLTVVGGSVFLGPGAKIDGEVVSIGGPVESDPESFVRGGITELAMGPNFSFDGFDWVDGDWLGFLWPGSWFQFGWSDTFDLIGNALFLALIMMFLVFIARRLVERVARRADREPWKSALVGLLVQILIGPVVFLLFVLLMISVVGIPLAVLLLPLSIMALVLFFLLGYAGVARVAGGWLETRFNRPDLGPYVAVLLGIVLIQGWSILGEALSFGGGPIQFTAVLFIILGFLLKYYAWTTGLGAVVLHSFSPDPATAAATATVALPPPPPPTDDLDGIEDSWSAGEVDEHREWEDAAREAEEAEADSEPDDSEDAEDTEDVEDAEGSSKTKDGDDEAASEDGGDKK